ncbi:MAG: ABC transporter substrate-binding protein, partial [Alphaproteobacteria bacterium]
NVTYNGYVAMRELLRAVSDAGTTNNISVIKQLEGRVMSAADRMQHHDAVIDAHSHHVQQTIYLAARQDNPRDDTDYFKIVNVMDPKSVQIAGEAECNLESYADTPTYEM